MPPLYYGGVERIVAFLAEGLKERGWDVTLACHPESACQVNQIHLNHSKSYQYLRVSNMLKIGLEVLKGQYDLIHSFAHCDLTALFWPSSRLQIQSFQSSPSLEILAKRMRFMPPKNLTFTTCGHHMVRNISHLAPTWPIHNGVRIHDFTFRDNLQPDAPLVFLGRIEPIKGTHTAILIAKATHRSLVIAGNRSDNAESDRYFNEEVAPHFSDQITYMGPVDDRQKNELLGKCAALLMPIEWDEPFGIVMAEALACGTPVIGYARGALPEIVDHGISGACCHSVEEMVRAVLEVGTFSRSACQRAVEERFSAPIIVEQYITLYKSILGHD